ncbi:MAG: hypothetical protein IJU26_01250 [Synergistaceae bacterium]|nr:hypothetical protein [Synergistaceae bacterium]
MHTIHMCKLCGKIYDPAYVPVDKSICADCLERLEDMYSIVHSFIRDNKEDTSFDPVYLSKMTNISLDNIKLLISMGYLERDMQTWSKAPSKRAALAKEFEHELDVMAERYKLVTYGGKVYTRKNTYGGQRGNRHSDSDYIL